MRRSVAVAALVLLLGAGAVSCATGDASTEAGFGLPTQPPDDPVAGEREELRGTLHVEDDGCFTWVAEGGDEASRPWIVWPSGGQHDGDHVTLPDGTSVGQGDLLVATGAHVEPEALPDYRDGGDSYFSSFGGFCGVRDRGVVVLDEVRRG
ncbi:hypothetical protein [Cellulomonas carbonis]|uniref:Lipoprotein n=1 Tax=Cellulomonas carbonis T26 TaxID=947969 RepID=A0A0A0BTZ1_9CELL|nr:hypothetical protein [Cellulomonas carbonis]KGM11430.1 hypothetical protein N868_10375 [Cellulomonas carbonis T26]GGC09267.1 hypothetical protein GCM10010972_23230 [Cellulomonas carbonis]